MYDYIIRGCTIFDGSGKEGFRGDIALQNDVIADVGQVTGNARHVINADGAIVTPAWIDIHTHFDGQVTWDSEMNPSASHGVGTVVMGNCGVGFAPVQKGGYDDLVELMEGVEDIPGTALSEGMPWGKWHSYPEYLDFLGKREYALNISSMIAHSAVRNYVMGERGRCNETATEDDLQDMKRIVVEALQHGAVGFSTGRTNTHRYITGESVPGTFANDEELLMIADALKQTGTGVFQAVPSGVLGPGYGDFREPASPEAEVDLLIEISKASGRPVTFTLLPTDSWPDKWRNVLQMVKDGNAQGGRVYPQVAVRPVGTILSLKTHHPFMLKPTYRKRRHLPFDQLLGELRKPEIKAAILKEDKDFTDVARGSMEYVIGKAALWFEKTYPFSKSSTWEPEEKENFASMAAAAGETDPLSYFYDYLVANPECNFAIQFLTGYSDFNLDAVYEMNNDPSTVLGLSDAGAHVAVICDAVVPTYSLSYWARDRKRGPTLPLAHLIHRMTRRNADLFGFHDRGLLAPGMRADLNVIDFDNLALADLEVRNDLPAGGKRLLQSANGYLATFINGELTRENDHDTGARPGRLINNRSH